MDSILSRIVADNEQDLAAGRAWFDAATDADLITVWKYLQRDFRSPVGEICSRLAALQLATWVEERLRRKAGA